MLCSCYFPGEGRLIFFIYFFFKHTVRRFIQNSFKFKASSREATEKLVNQICVKFGIQQSFLKYLKPQMVPVLLGEIS